MKILCSVYNWFNSGTSGIAGGEIYLYRLIQYLRKQRHEFRLITGAQEQYTYDGIECYPQGTGQQMYLTNNDHVQWADICLMQLLGSAYMYNKAVQHNKPMVFIAHNNSKNYPIRYAQPDKSHIIYNSYQLREDLHKTFQDFNTIVCHPTIPQFERSKGNKITLVNCSHNKGGHILGELARLLPQYDFLGVFGGYQDQIEVHLPNITYLPNGTDMAEVYRQTKILIAPSEFESYSQCAAEALTAGIPVIAHPTPGLQENLSYAGIFVDRNDISKYVSNIVYLMNSNSYYVERSEMALKRAQSCRDMNSLELINLNKWLNNIK